MYSHLIALVLALSGTASAYTINNVTVSAVGSGIEYFSSCASATYPECQGAWWSVPAPDGSGQTMVTTGPDNKFGQVEPYWTYTFTGTDAWLYAWVNSSSTDFRHFSPTDELNALTTMQTDHPTEMNSPELTLVLAYSFHGLPATKQSTIGIQHFVDPINTQRRNIVIDHLVVATTTLDASELSHKKSNIGTIAGAVVGALLGISGLALGTCLFMGWKRRSDARKARARGYDWKGSHAVKAGGSSLKFGDPSSEIEHSERMAREGRLEEMLEKNAVNYKLPSLA